MSAKRKHASRSTNAASTSKARSETHQSSDPVAAAVNAIRLHRVRPFPGIPDSYGLRAIPKTKGQSAK
jgi:hypothetical protein